MYRPENQSVKSLKEIRKDEGFTELGSGFKIKCEIFDSWSRKSLENPSLVSFILLILNCILQLLEEAIAKRNANANTRTKGMLSWFLQIDAHLPILIFRSTT